MTDLSTLTPAAIRAAQTVKTEYSNFVNAGGNRGPLTSEEMTFTRGSFRIPLMDKETLELSNAFQQINMMGKEVSLGRN